jgi:hypothetical protein
MTGKRKNLSRRIIFNINGLKTKQKKIKFDKCDLKLINQYKIYWNLKIIININTRMNNIHHKININGDINIKDDSKMSLLQFCFYNDLDNLSKYIFKLKDLKINSLLEITEEGNLIHIMLSKLNNLKIENFREKLKFLNEILKKKNINLKKLINQKNNEGFTPLSYLIYYHNLNLLNQKKFVDLKSILNEYGAEYDFFCQALDNNLIKINQNIISNFNNKKFGSLLHISCKFNFEDLIKKIININKNNDIFIKKINDNETPAITAIKNDHFNIISIFINNNINFINNPENLINCIEDKLLINDGKIYGLNPIKNKIFHYSLYTKILFSYMFKFKNFKINSQLSSLLLYRWIERLKIHNIKENTPLYNTIYEIINILLNFDDINFNHVIADCDDKTLESFCSDDLLFDYLFEQKSIKNYLPINFCKKLLFNLIDYPKLFLKILNHEKFKILEDGIIYCKISTSYNDKIYEGELGLSIVQYLVKKSIDENEKYKKLIKQIFEHNSELNILKSYGADNKTSTFHYLISKYLLHQNDKDSIEYKVIYYIYKLFLNIINLKKEEYQKIIIEVRGRNFLKNIKQYKNCKNFNDDKNLQKIYHHINNCNDKENCYICYTNYLGHLINYF